MILNISISSLLRALLEARKVGHTQSSGVEREAYGIIVDEVVDFLAFGRGCTSTRVGRPSDDDMVVRGHGCYCDRYD